MFPDMYTNSKLLVLQLLAHLNFVPDCVVDLDRLGVLPVEGFVDGKVTERFPSSSVGFSTQICTEGPLLYNEHCVCLFGQGF